jgi:hypothetical protein
MIPLLGAVAMPAAASTVPRVDMRDGQWELAAGTMGVLHDLSLDHAWWGGISTGISTLRPLNSTGWDHFAVRISGKLSEDAGGAQGWSLSAGTSPMSIPFVLYLYGPVPPTYWVQLAYAVTRPLGPFRVRAPLARPSSRLTSKTPIHRPCAACCSRSG